MTLTILPNSDVCNNINLGFSHTVELYLSVNKIIYLSSIKFSSVYNIVKKSWKKYKKAKKLTPV
jgi:hypothetical protein